ncbi:MAG TPA: tetratricopeptide repeat protein [Oceanipulchritudo sp.]|nr:tetratricopeptide repeat protein [Oceanipulchritudo sp.]
MSKEKKEPEQPLNPQNLDPESDLPPDADVEERFNDFWKRNGPGIFGGIAIGALLVVGIQVYQYLGEKKEEEIGQAFAETATEEEKLSFANTHSEHQLGALAWLQVADARYGEDAFAEAAELYDSAAESFEDPTLRTRAQLGQGMSLLQSGSVEAGRAVLESVALNRSALDQTRGEAAYHLAVSYWEAGEEEQVEEATSIILDLEAPFWEFRATSLRDRLDLDDSSIVADPAG